MIKLKNVINKHKSNKIKENPNTVRHWNNGTDHRHSKSCCDKSSPARRTKTTDTYTLFEADLTETHPSVHMHQNVFTTWFWRNNDIIPLCACWDTSADALSLIYK